LWRLVLVAKYGLDWGVGAQGSSLALMGGPYGNIFAWVGRSLAATSSFVPGEGSRIRFWEDPWCGDRALKDAFPCFDSHCQQ
jgi:hypothetical protein